MADRWSETESDPSTPEIDPTSARIGGDPAAVVEESPMSDFSGGESSNSGVSAAVDSARREAGKVTDTAKEQAGQVVGEVGRQAKSLFEETRLQLRGQAQEQADRISVTLTDLANELRGMADNAPDPSSSVATLVGDGARRLEDFATHLQSGGLDGVMDDSKAMARRRPGAFLAGAAAAGVVVGRLFRNVDLSQQSSGDDGFRAAGQSLSSPMGSTATNPSSLSSTASGTLNSDDPQRDYAGTSSEPEAGRGW